LFEDVLGLAGGITLANQAAVRERLECVPEIVFLGCDLHRTNWSLAAELAIRFYDEGNDFGRTEALSWLRQNADLGDDQAERVARGVASFLWHPIAWPDKTAALANGNNRVCALKQQRVEHCLVKVDYP